MRIRIDKRDTLFSKLIKERDQRCSFCGKQETKLENSHYWGRANKSTRFDPENCDLLCFYCHLTHEGSKQGFYREWKLKQLGTKKYNALERRARTPVTYRTYEKEKIYERLKSRGLKNLTQFLKRLWTNLK